MNDTLDLLRISGKGERRDRLVVFVCLFFRREMEKRVGEERNHESKRESERP